MRIGGRRSSRAATVMLDVALMCDLLPAAHLARPGAVPGGPASRVRAAASQTPTAACALRQNRRMTSPDTAADRTTPADITAAVEASFADAPDPRLREVMQALVRHLHAFVADVGL